MAILTTWKKEKRYSGSLSPSYKSFKDWAQGLPSILDTCYYYNRSAIDDLEETIKAKYNDEEAAADALTRFIYDELNEAVTFKYSVGDIVRFKGWCIDTLGIVIYIENGTMPYLVKIINKGAETEVWAGDEDLEAVNIKK